MNTMQDLINHGIDEYTAESMLSRYKERIGTMNGIYEIVDINYDFSVRGRDVTLRCSSCGKIIHRTVMNGRNKWNELIRNCECQKESKRISEILESEKFLKLKKDKMVSEIGNEYGDYEVIGINFGNPDMFVVRCRKCGYEKKVSANTVINGSWKDAACHKHYVQPIKYDESYIGKKKNFLTVIDIGRNKNGERRFVCRCECGNVKQVSPTFWERGEIKSCGCKRDELVSSHGLSGTRLYRIWNGMNQRFYNEKSISYECYGGRGIRICQEWLGQSGMLRFIDWAMKNGYSDKLSIDRIDVNGNYEPSNCCWADIETQIENRRPKSEWKKRKKGVKHKAKITWTINGIQKPARDWCAEYGVSYEMVSYRVKHKSMSIEEALTAPRMADGRPRKQVEL